MIKEVVDYKDIIEVNRIEQIVSIENAIFPDQINRKLFDQIWFLPEAYLIDLEIEKLMMYLSSHEYVYISRHSGEHVTYFAVKDLNLEDWSNLFNGKSIHKDFAYFLYADYVTIFSESNKWLYFHKMDMPNLFFCDKGLLLSDKFKSISFDLNYIKEFYEDEDQEFKNKLSKNYLNVFNIDHS